ncbi:xylose operon repressor [Clostridia bacterium]|nr:xylose operon repressor [Clostridia bacterium]
MNRNNGAVDIRVERGDLSSLRERNTSRVLNVLRRGEATTRVDIAEFTNLDKKTVTNIVGDLLDRKIIRVFAKYSDGAGRPKEKLEIRGDYARFAGIDLGGTHLSGVIVDYTGAQVASCDVDVNNDMEPDTLIKLCGYLMDNLAKKAGTESGMLKGIGISFPGFVTPSASGAVTSENLPKWIDAPVRTLFQEAYHVPVFVDDSSRLMALAELWFGKGRDCDNFIVADLGLGIGCGVVLERRIFRGSNGKSGEIGHTVVDVNGPACTCGSHGCIESFAAGWSLSRQAWEIMRANPRSLLRETCRSVNLEPSIREVVLAAELGDDELKNLLSKAGEYIGLGFSNAISMFNPQRLIIGGRLTKSNPLLMDALIATIRTRCMKEILDDVEIVESELGISASAWGAGIACIQGLEAELSVGWTADKACMG